MAIQSNNGTNSANNNFFANTTQVKVKLVDSETAIPIFTFPGDVAVDLRSRIKYVLEPFKMIGIPTRIAIELPKRSEGQIRPRSGLALKYGVTI